MLRLLVMTYYIYMSMNKGKVYGNCNWTTSAKFPLAFPILITGPSKSQPRCIRYDTFI